MVLPDPDGIQPWMLPLILAYCRIQGCILVIPAYSAQMLPARIKVSLAIALTPLFATAFPGPVHVASLQGLALLVMGEVLVGLLIGGLVRLTALALEVAGTAIASTASLSQIVGVSNEYAPHPVGNLLNIAGFGLLMVLGYPLMVCDLIQQSMIIKPAGAWPNADGLVAATVGIVASSFQLALILAAPFVLGGFLYQALSGVISKVMPSLPIVFIGAPAAILLALLGLALLTNGILSVWADAVLSFTLPDLR